MPAIPEETQRRVVTFPATSHLRVLGPPASGKTTLLIERYRAMTSANSALRDRVFVLTYSNASLKRLTEAIIGKGDAHVGVPPVMTYFRLAREIIAATGKRPPAVAEEIDERLLIDLVIDRNRERLRSDYRNIADSEALRGDLLHVFRLLMQNGVADAASRQRLSSAASSHRIADAVFLYGDFIDTLRERRSVTFYNIAWLAAAELHSAQPDHPLRRAALLLVDDVQDIDAGQFELLHALAPPDGELKLNVFGDPLGPLFGFRGTDDRFLRDVLPDLYGMETVFLGARCIDAALQPALSTLLREIAGEGFHTFLSGAAAPAPLARADESGQFSLFESAPPRTDSVTLDLVDDEVEEAYAVAARVHQLITSGRYRGDDIAVITNRRVLYEPLLTLAFYQRGVALATGRSAAGVFAGFVRALLHLLSGRDDDSTKRAVVTSPFYPFFRRECMKTPRTTAEVERSRRELTIYLAAQREELRKVADADKMSYVLAQCLRPACGPCRDETGDESAYEVMSALRREWEAFVAAVADVHPGRIAFDTFMRTSATLSPAQTTPTPGAGTVGLYSCRETKGRFFPVVIVVGCSEMLFPAVARREGVVPASELQQSLAVAFPEQHIRVHQAQNADDHLAEEYHLLLQSITRATEQVHITAPRQVAGATYPAPSVVLGSLCDARAPADTTISPPQLRFADGWVRSPNDPQVSSRVAHLNRLAAIWNIPPSERPPFCIDTFPLSKTSIQTFLECPRRFFYRKVLRLREEETIHLQLGSIYHDIMAGFGAAFRTKREWHDAMSEERITAAVDRALSGHHGVEPRSFVADALRYHLANMIRRSLRLDDDVSSNYAIENVEIPIPFEYEGRDFIGVIDRVEHASESGITLTDYKTGKFNKTGKNLRARIVDTFESASDEANWQVPLYVEGYRKHFGSFPSQFKHYVVPPDGDPFHVTIYIRPHKSDVPAEGVSNRREDQHYSYLLTGEVESAVNAAACVAESIVAERTTFDKTDNEKHCRACTYRRLCERAS